MIGDLCRDQTHQTSDNNTLAARRMTMPKLVNVKLDLKVPGIGGISGTWEPDESEVRAAWELYV